MSKMRNLVLMTSAAMILAACNLSNPFRTGNKLSETQLLEKILENTGEVYDYQIYLDNDAQPGYLVQKDASNNMQVVNYTKNPSEIIITSAQNETFYQYQGNWLKLKIGKTNLAHELAGYDILSWPVESIEQAVISPHETEANEDISLGKRYRVNLGELNFEIQLKPDSQALASILISGKENTYRLEYLDEQPGFTLPVDYQEYSIPDQPSEDELKIINDIYAN